MHDIILYELNENERKQIGKIRTCILPRKGDWIKYNNKRYEILYIEFYIPNDKIKNDNEEIKVINALLIDYTD